MATNNGSEGGVKIIRLTATNIKKLSAVEINPGNIVIVSGDNNQGKSSVLDAIQYALAGKTSIPQKPIRDGEERGEIVLELSNLIVERVFTDDDKSYLSVKTKDGAAYGSPQTILDALLGELTFDPLEFAKMKVQEQIDVLKKFIPAKNSPDIIDAKIKELFDKRTIQNREIKTLEQRLRDIPEPDANAPDKEISFVELSKKKDELLKHQTNKENHLNSITNKTAKITEYNEALKELERRVEEGKKKIAAIKIEIDELNKNVPADKSKELTEINQQIANSERINIRVRQKKLFSDTQNELGDMKVISEGYTKGIDDLKELKIKIFEETKFPVKGLQFDQDGIFFEGIPFNQLSSSKQLHISTMIAMSLNPDLKVMFTKHGNDLDEKNLKELCSIVEANGYQIWIERIDSAKGLPSVVIEDGMVKEVKKVRKQKAGTE